jgi:hypothetical protein
VILKSASLTLARGKIGKLLMRPSASAKNGASPASGRLDYDLRVWRVPRSTLHAMTTFPLFRDLIPVRFTVLGKARL